MYQIWHEQWAILVIARNINGRIQDSPLRKYCGKFVGAILVIARNMITHNPISLEPHTARPPRRSSLETPRGLHR